MVVSDNGSGVPEKKEKRARRSGTETIVYLKEKSLTRPQSSSYNTRHGARLGGKG